MPNTVFDNLDRLHNASLAITAAITAKGGTVNQGDGFEEYPDDIATIPTGGATELKDVDFIDYDGTLIKTYTSQEFLALTSMPTNPSHEGLIAQGWNWTLSDAKAYVTSYGALVIGQSYTTSDGKTRIYIKLPEHRTSPCFQVYSPSSGTTVDVDWGDGSEHTTLTATYGSSYLKSSHEYAAPGEYVISFTVTTGTVVIRSYSSYEDFSTLISLKASEGNSYNDKYMDQVYMQYVQKVEIGNNVLFGDTGYSVSSFSGLPITSISIPNTATGYMSKYAFSNCKNLKGLVLPSGITTIGGMMCKNCTSLELISLPKSMTQVSVNDDTEVFSGCTNLKKVTMSEQPKIGDRMFQDCPNLKCVIFPDNVSWIGYYVFYRSGIETFRFPSSATTFSGNYRHHIFKESKLKEIYIPDTVTELSNGIFEDCYYLRNVRLSANCTSIKNDCFNNCYALLSIDVPEGYTSIGDYAFDNNYALSIVRLPSTLTSIGSSAFANCLMMDILQFKSTTPPTPSSNTFTSLPRTTAILVPVDSYSAYISAQYYPSSANYTYLGFGTYASGASLPETDTGGSYFCTWYASVHDALDEVNPITVGNGNEVYAVMSPGL